MALLKKIKEALGFGSAPPERDGVDTEVTVEHEPDDADTESAADTASTGSEAEGEPVASGTDAAASTESLVDEDSAAVDPDEAAEPAEAAGGADDETAVDDDDIGPGVENITGIGPAYAERLAEIDIETIDELAVADAADVDEQTSVGETRATTWIERANEF